MAEEKSGPPKVENEAGSPAPKTPSDDTVIAKPAVSKNSAPADSKDPAKPPGTAVPPVKAAPAAKPPAAPKPPVKPDPWTSPLLDDLNKRFPGAIAEAVIFRNQPSLNVAKEHLLKICEFLKSPEGGGYNLLTDETAVDFPKRDKRFDVVYHLYSFSGNSRLRLRLQIAADETIPSVVGVWPTANWLEREIFDLFGITFDGHPDLKRILMPDGWTGHPLRKDYDILKQDVDWVKANLSIESGQ